MNRLWDKFVDAATTDLGLKILSLIIALALWLFVNAGQKPAEKTVEVPVQFRNTPTEMIVTNPPQEQIEVRVMGPPAVLSTIDSDQLRIVLDLDGARPGTSTFRLTPDFFRTPRGVRITHISPSIVNLKIEAVAVRSLPVKVRFGEKLPFGYKIASVDVSPDRVRVRGPAGDVNRIGSVETLPVDAEGLRGKISREVRLDYPGKEVSLSPDRVTVSVLLEEESITREFPGVKVRAVDAAGDYKVTPGEVYLRLSGPKRTLAPFKIGDGMAYLDLKGLARGNHTLELTFKLPAEIKVMEQKPNRFRVRIDSDRP